MVENREMLVRLWRLVKPHWRGYTTATIVTQLLNALRSAQPLFTRYAIDWYVIPKTSDGLIWLASAFIGLRILTFWLFYYQRVLLSALQQKIIANLRIRLNQKLYATHYSYFEVTPKGKITTHFMMDVESIAEMMTTFVAQVIGDAVIVVATLVTLLWIDAYLTLLLAVTVLPLWPLFRYCRNSVQRAQSDLKEKFSELNAFLQEYICGVLTIQVFNAEERAQREFERTNHDLRQAINRSKFRQVGLTVIVELMMALTLAMLIVFGGWQILHSSGGPGELTIGKFVAFIQGALQLIEPMRNISNNFSIIQDGMVSMRRVFGVLEAPVRLSSPAQPRRLERARGLIEFENVSFAYRGEDWVLKDLSLRIDPGESIAIVGPTGAGKTTIANLLLRFYDVQRGRILLDNIDIRELDLEVLRNHYAVALQDAFIFSESVRYNLLLGNAELDDRQLREVAARANAAGFIENLPQRYDTPVGDGGSHLSLGQKQLLSLCRAICRNRSIFVLDEICRSVDPEIEALVDEVIKSLVKEHTSILISHRLSTIKHVDRIVLLHQGRVFEEGPHDELLGRRGMYWQLYQAWL
ncbi:MAG TPA: ABC transporter ATP-binding protein [Blastocatellia bacterium]|nr:ABC transporter ATP-binding protein [Blastocatellia bacterium]